MPYKCFVTLPDGERVSNGLVFRTDVEAKKYGDDLLSRWTAPVSHESEETQDSVTHEWNHELGKVEPVPEVLTYKLDRRDLTVS